MVDVKIVKGDDHDHLIKALDSIKNKVGKVGWFAGSRYDDNNKTPVAEVAAQNEYGNPAKHIPARPFMRPTIYEQQNAWRKIAEDGAKQILKGNYTSEQVLDLLGQKAVGDIKRTISRIQSPPLSPKTIQARLNKRKDKKTIGLLTKPLIDTGIMLNTITSVVEDG